MQFSHGQVLESVKPILKIWLYYLSTVWLWNNVTSLGISFFKYILPVATLLMWEDNSPRCLTEESGGFL